MIIVGIDTGGTFTDFIYKKENQWGVYKLLSTPGNPAEAVIEGLSRIVEKEGLQVVHGSTVATNAILERKGVKTAVVTNSGFEDLLQIGRQSRKELYNLFYSKESRIVPDRLCFGISGRIVEDGTELEPFSQEQAQKVAAVLKKENVESVAVCFLFSYLAPEHENKMAELLQGMDLHVSKSHAILSEFREFERLSTTVVNAYVSPKMSRYLEKLQSYIQDNPFRIMQSNGGSISVKTATQESVRTILSGPAGGVVGAHSMGRATGFEKLITFDMGGTSTDVCLIDQNTPLSLESSISGYPLRVPMLDIHTVGAGGGSIASLDPGGSLKVGPESAGADPGPICYGKGEQITVTDANFFLGRLIPEQFLGGGMSLKTERLKHYFKDMAEQAGLWELELGQGILDVTNTNMERAIRIISVEKGYDPREFTLFSFGGAGGMHCAFLARFLSIPRILVPKNPGILSAMGMVMADVIKDYSQTVMLRNEETDFNKLKLMFEELNGLAVKEMLEEGFPRERIDLEPYLDMRYQGQSFEIIVPFEDKYELGFSRLHEKKYGYQNPDRSVEIVNLRLRARGRPDKPELVQEEEQARKVPEQAYLDKREVVFNSKTWTTDILNREYLLPGNEFKGPAILTEYTSTIVLPPFVRARVDGFRNVLLEIEG